MKTRAIYTSIRNVGCTDVDSDHPLTYCLTNAVDQKFIHGSSANIVSGPSARNCQLYLAEYCANGWDKFCEFASQNNNTSFPNTFDGIDTGLTNRDVNLTQGEILIYNTAKRKYLVSNGNCFLKHEPFDPTVANSPMISYWSKKNSSCVGATCGNGCFPEFAVDPKTINDDPVMNKILQKPSIALDILVNIFNTSLRKKNLDSLKNTKLWNFYSQYPYFASRMTK